MTSDLTHVERVTSPRHATHAHTLVHAVCRIVARQPGQATAAAIGQAGPGHFALRLARTPIGDALRSGDGSFRVGRGLRGVSHDTRWPICQPPSLGPKDTARARSMGLSVPRAQEWAGLPAGCAAATTAVANGRELAGGSAAATRQRTPQLPGSQLHKRPRAPCTPLPRWRANRT